MTITAFALLGMVGLAQAPDLARRIESGPDGFISIAYAARPDVCGSGFSSLRVGLSGFGDGGYSYVWSDGVSDRGCESGPIRLLLSRVGGTVAGIRVGVGAVVLPAGTTDLGPVAARSAAEYLFALAARLDGRIGREAMTAGALADSADTWRGLAALASNRVLSRGLRESAASWLARDAGADAGATGGLVRVLAELARDGDAPTTVRTRAAAALGRAGAPGVAVLLDLARGDDAAVAKASMTALGRSRDPRAREALRRAAADSSGVRSVRLEAIRALGGRDAAPGDLAALRALWPGLGTAELRAAVLQLAAEAGGAENARWLLAVAQSGTESSAVRAQAVRFGEQAGVGSAELVRLYDQAADRKVKEAVLEALVRIGDRASRAKLANVAENDTDPGLRRTAIARLSRDGDRQSLEVLEGVIARPPGAGRG